MKKPKGLGRGLESLLGEQAAAPVSGAPTELRIAQLRAGKYQPRTRMDEGALAELAQSIQSQGLMQPILVRPVASNNLVQQYEIIAGERRYRAAQLAGLDVVPVLVKEVPDESAAVMALIENIQREDLNALEEARGVERLLNEFKLTHEQAAHALGRSRSATSNLLRLLNLATPVQDLLMAGDIDMGHARALLAVDAATQIMLANQIVAKGLNVRETEKLVNQHVLRHDDTAAKPAKPVAANRDLSRLVEQLSDVLASKVEIKANAKGRGQVVIDFASWAALEGVTERLLKA